jgi:hypothetical protein
VQKACATASQLPAAQTQLSEISTGSLLEFKSIVVVADKHPFFRAATSICVPLGTLFRIYLPLLKETFEMPLALTVAPLRGLLRESLTVPDIV